MKLFLFIVLNLFSFAALAHSGHGGDNLFVHAMDHALWLVGGLAIVGCIFFYKRRQ